jgi:hypothetical protein
MKSTKSLILLMILSLVSTTFTILPCSATTPRLYLQPSNITYTTDTAWVGLKFNVTVWVESAPDLGGAQIYLEFNDSIINVTRWICPHGDPYFFMPEPPPATELPTSPDPGYIHVAPGKGYVKVSVSKGGLPPGPPWGHSGKIAIFEFNITDIPTEPGETFFSALHINTTDTFLLDPDAVKVPNVIKEDGTYQITKPAPPPPPEGSRIFVDPPEIIDPTLVPSSTFSINITIDDMENIETCEFNLTYNTNIIGFITISFLRVNNQFPFPETQANERAGYIWVRLFYSSPITVYDPTPLVTIIFHVENLGATPLNLTNTKIMDPLGNLLPHDVYHGFFAALIRDVAVTNISLSSTWAYQGWKVNITVTVLNKGNVSETFDVSTYYDSTLIGTITVIDLTPNEERNIIFEWDTTGVTEGNYTIKAEAQTVPYEMNTADNILTNGKVWIMEQKHDVAIVSIALSQNWIYHGLTIYINVTAQNIGAFNETFQIKAYYNDTLIGTVPVANLLPGDYYEARFSINTSILEPCHTYIIKGEATLVPYEYDETNNILIDGYFKVRFVGDLNGDDQVDLVDVFMVSQAFGSYPGHPRWNPLADINLDNQVDLIDVYIVSSNYGKGCHR